MGQIKNIKLHIVTDIKESITGFVASSDFKMTNTIEKPVAEPVEEKKVEKEPLAEPESTTTEDEPVEPEVNGNGKAEEENGNGHTEETEKEGNGHTEETEKEGNGHTEETEEEETTLKRKDAPTEVEEDSPKKKKLIDSDEKEAAAVEA